MYIDIFCEQDIFIQMKTQIGSHSRYFNPKEKKSGKIRTFDLVSLLNVISTFVGYLMPKLFSSKNSSGTI